MKTLFFLMAILSSFNLFSSEGIARQQVVRIYEDYSAIEQALVSLAIQRGNEQWQEKIKSSLEDLTQIEKSKHPDPESWFEKNFAFHLAIVKGCGSQDLIDLRNELYGKLKQFTTTCKNFAEMQFETAKTPLVINNDEHRAIAEAVLTRNEKRACELINAHIMGHCEEMLALLHL